MKTNNKRIKTAAICGALAVLSLVNVCVLSFNKNQVSPILTRNVNADAGILGPYYFFIELFGGSGSNLYYKYDEAEAECNPVTISEGTMSAEQLINSVFNANASIPQGSVKIPLDASAFANLEYKKNKKGSFDFKVTISLSGDKWRIKTCEPCNPTEPDVLSTRCVNYDQCAEAMKTRIKAYREALGI